MTTHWYALQSKPMKEAFLCTQLHLNKIESYCPQIRVQAVNPRARKFKPYFPGYVFGYIGLEQLTQHTLSWIPGLANIVSFDGIPIDVPDNFIAAIRRKVDQINAVGSDSPDTWKPGDLVTVQEGLFKGYVATLDTCVSGEARVRILLTVLNRLQVRLELPRGQVQPMKH
jgi:transcription antitermination factor NusG